jgi:glucokinase-like ROK family protein
MSGRPSVPAGAGAGAMLSLIRQGRATTRADLAALTGMARSTVAQRVQALIAGQLVYESEEGASTGGRPPRTFVFNQAAGVVLAADLGATHSRIAMTDLAGEVLAEHAEELEIASGPENVLAWLRDAFDRLLDESGRTLADVRGVGVGVPGPVEFATGRPVNPPIMPGWDNHPVSDELGDHYDAPVLVDNDVNIMALGEHWSAWPLAEHLLYVKVGTGIGCGIVAGGEIHRGAEGAAGDIGHIRVTADESVVCRCGNVGCLEAVAGGRAIAMQLRDLGMDAESSRGVVRQVRAGNPDAVRLVREAGRTLGDVLASVVNFFNPAVIVIGGDVAEAHEQLLAGVREVVYQRSLPLATRHLRVVRSSLGDRAGVTGAAVMVIEHVLSPEAVDRALAAALEG